MKTKLPFRFLSVLILTVFFSLNVKAQVRIVEVDPATDNVKIHNYGGATVDISNYWFCSQIVYGRLGLMTVVSGSLNLASGADVVVTSSVDLAAAADLGLYNSPSFGSTTAMTDFTQWGGSFSFPAGRENVAVAKGIWTAGTFISVAAPYQYTGNGGQNGFQFWQTLLGLEDFKIGNNFNLYPNPTSSILSVTFKNEVPNGTLEVYDVLGKKAMSQKLKSDVLTSINISSLDNGVYFIKVSYDGKSETKRFIKN
ncbi:MAG: T9SS type A sorting domain-containing protein [Flavobacteriaceae bacterium]